MGRPKTQFHVIEPGGIRQGIVDMVLGAGALGQLRTDLRMFRRRIVIDERMDVRLWRHSGVDLAQKGEELQMPVAAAMVRPPHGLCSGDLVRLVC